MVAERTRVGHELETALGEVLAQLRAKQCCRAASSEMLPPSTVLRSASP